MTRQQIEAAIRETDIQLEFLTGRYEASRTEMFEYGDKIQVVSRELGKLLQELDECQAVEDEEIGRGGE